MRHRSLLLGNLRDDDGSASLFAVGLVFVATVVFLPLVWNMGSIYTARRISQNGTDAAALAGAESVARRLNQLSTDWWGCIPPETPPTIVERYKQQVVAPVAGSRLGAGSAAEYAASNKTTLAGYQQRLKVMGADGVHAKLVDGSTVYPVHVDTATTSPTKGFLQPGRYTNQTLRARATAETYLSRVYTWETPCPTNPKAIARHYSFTWKVRLVKTGW